MSTLGGGLGGVSEGDRMGGGGGEGMPVSEVGRGVEGVERVCHFSFVQNHTVEKSPVVTSIFYCIYQHVFTTCIYVHMHAQFYPLLQCLLLTALRKFLRHCVVTVIRNSRNSN